MIEVKNKSDLQKEMKNKTAKIKINIPDFTYEYIDELNKQYNTNYKKASQRDHIKNAIDTGEIDEFWNIENLNKSTNNITIIEI